MVTARNNLELWYKDQSQGSQDGTYDYIQSTTPSAILSISDGHKANISIASIVFPAVYAASSLGYTNFFYAQMAESLRIQAYNISWSGNNTEIVHNDTFSTPGKQGLAGTHLAVTVLPNKSGGDSLVVFFQNNGSDITEYIRALSGGRWSQVDIPISDE